MMITGRIEEQEEFSEKSDEIVLDLYAAIGDVSDFQDKLEEHFPELFPSYYDVVDELVQEVESGKRSFSLDELFIEAKKKSVPFSMFGRTTEIFDFLGDSGDNYFEEVQEIQSYIRGKIGDLAKEQQARNPDDEIKEAIKENLETLVISFLEELEEEMGEKDDFKYFLDFDVSNDDLSSDLEYPFIINFYKGATDPGASSIEYQGTPPPDDEEEEYREKVHDYARDYYDTVSELFSRGLEEARFLANKALKDGVSLDDLDDLETIIQQLSNYEMGLQDELQGFSNKMIELTD